MFHEITRPFKVLKSQILPKANVFSSSKKLTEDFVESSNVRVDLPPVDASVTKNEFKKRYTGLSIHTSVILFFTSYSVLFLIFAINFVAILVSLSVLVFFCVAYLSSIYKAWLARFYFRNWESRFSKSKLGFSDFIDDVFNKPRLLLPVYDINKEI